ncbi:MAG: Ig-like domain-containing protein, partial [Anaerolineales bacterium]
MSYATQSLPPLGWEAPPNIVRVKVCEPSGLLPTPDCQQTRDEIFIQGTEPNAPDNVWQRVAVNRETGKRATACTPPELVEQRVYEILPPEAADWVRTVGLAQPPIEYDPLAGACLAGGDVAILSPQPFAYVRGMVEVTGTAKGDNFGYFWVQYGSGLFPQTWSKIEGDRGEQIENGLLQPWNTAGLDGLYSLQLVVVRNDPNGGPPTFDLSTLQVTVDNQPPTVTLLTPAPGQEFTVGRDESVIIQPQVSDNLSVARVAFFIDNVANESATVPPYSTRWTLSDAHKGAHTIFVRAYDAAGNFTDSQATTITVK